MVLEAVQGERTVSELAAEYGVHPTMIHQWKKALLDGASDIFERSGKKKAEVDEFGSQETDCLRATCRNHVLVTSGKFWHRHPNYIREGAGP